MNLNLYNFLKRIYCFFIFICFLFNILLSCSSNTTEKSIRTDGIYYNFQQDQQNHKPKLFQVSIENESHIEINLERNPREIEQSAKADMEMHIDYDSSMNSIITTTYRNIKFSKKDGTEEISYDASDGVNSFDPTTRILGMLKNASITSTVSPKGEILSVKGLKELGDSVMATVNIPDIVSGQKLRQQWDNMIQDGIVNKNTRQLFGVIPDTAVSIGDRWTRQYTEKEDIALGITVTYTLNKVKDGIAYISSSGIIKADNSQRNMLQVSGQSELNGKMKGNYEIDMASGLVLKSDVETNAEGVLIVMGKSIPIEIQNKVKVLGKVISIE
jgi:Family of unknown function (DUF6263)